MMKSKTFPVEKMFYVINTATKQIRTFAGRSELFPFRKVAERYAAKANRYGYHDAENHYVVISVREYHDRGYHQLTRPVVNLMTGKVVEENINTPYSCSVASESYWCS